jgi:hypothetical protein
VIDYDTMLDLDDQRLDEDDDSWWGVGRPFGPPVPADEYEADIDAIVRETAPRRFAIVQDWGINKDGRVGAWGVVREDEIHVIDNGAGRHHTMPNTEASINATLARYAAHPHLTARVVWLDRVVPGAV